MKLARNILPLVAVGNALVILPNEITHPLERPVNHAVDETRSWLDIIGTRSTSVLETVEDLFFPTAGLPDVDVEDVEAPGLLASLAADHIISTTSSSDFDLPHQPPHHHPPTHHPHHPQTSDKTIYELLELSNYTKTFFSLVSEHKSLVDTLNSTKANYTLFVPTDQAFEKIPPGHEKPSKEALEAFLKYHVVDGRFPAKALWFRHTLPTLLEERFLGGEKQRLRVRFTFKGVTVNLFSHVVAANIFASNGVIHGLDHILLPPVMAGKELSLLPSYFSTLLYAYDKTDFVSYIHKVHMVGSTIFAPTNHAFAKLGHRANAFLFETERGRGFLKALLKYQIAANTTLYSDAIYDKASDGNKNALLKGGKGTHYELKTLLDGKSLGVDIWRWGGWTRMKVNGFSSVVYEDAIAKNGVIQVVSSVPLPPCKHKGDGEQLSEDDTEISVEELVERLEGWMREDNVASDGKAVFEDL